MMPSKIEAPMWESNEQMREYDVKQWGKNGKAMEHLSRTLGKLIKTRGVNGWKLMGEGKMMVKLRLRCGTIIA